jgi:hypothetical protein
MEKDLIWVPKNVADEYKKMESDAGQLEFIEKYIEETRKDLKLDLDNFEDDVIKYRGLMLKAKETFRKAKEEELQANYDLWENFEMEKPAISEKINSIVNLLDPLKNELNEISGILKKIDLYELQNLEKTLNSIHNLYGDNKAMVEFLMLNYKK